MARPETERHGRILDHRRYERVPGLVNRDDATILEIHAPAALQAEHHLVARIVHVLRIHALLVATCGDQRGLVQQIGQFRAGKSGGAARDDVEIHVVG